ncbi:MAG TPA: dihydrofolate reductase family protein [Ilumatobacteraceae bacterium]|nr:dihydrofolate reductase family protein [Ilumatobacteraceae bacterium]HRB02078.1 dihydrofolate reductase family protein [Ilumatobacteraceae bacterium]
MRLVVSEFMSLDGVVQAPGGAEEDTDGGFSHGGWSMPWFDPDVMGGAIGAAIDETEALLFGRRTWQTMAAAWPDRAGSDPFADRMNALTKYVVSSTLSAEDLTWENSHLLAARNPMDAVAALKAEPGGTLVVMGSTQLTTALLSAGLVDELLLMIEPVLLGGGKTIFPSNGEMRALELISVQTTDRGVLVCTYRPGDIPPTPDFGGAGS